MTTLRFVAEDFEATATSLCSGDNCEKYWVVTAGGCRNWTVRSWGFTNPNEPGQHNTIQAWSDSIGWLGLTECSTPEPDLLALAISLLYSVPGVRVAEESR